MEIMHTTFHLVILTLKFKNYFKLPRHLYMKELEVLKKEIVLEIWGIKFKASVKEMAMV